MIGLCDATRTFNSDLGVTFATYASRACYTSALAEAVTKHVVRVPHQATQKDGMSKQNRRLAFNAKCPVQFVVAWHDVARDESSPVDIADELAAALAFLKPLDRYIFAVWSNGGTLKSIGRHIGMDRNKVSYRVRKAQAMVRERMG